MNVIMGIGESNAMSVLKDTTKICRLALKEVVIPTARCIKMPLELVFVMQDILVLSVHLQMAMTEIYMV